MSSLHGQLARTAVTRALPCLKTLAALDLTSVHQASIALAATLGGQRCHYVGFSFIYLFIFLF